MKRTYLARRNALLSRSDLSWGVLSLVFALLVLLVRLVLPGFFLRMTAPLFSVSDAIGASAHGFLASFEDASALSAKNEMLANENAALSAQNRSLQDRDAALISDSTGGAQKGAVQGIVAGVVARPPESPYDTLVISAGTNEGVAPKMEAFASGGVPIGVVSTVTPEFSRITLFSAPGVATAGWVGTAKQAVTIFGAGGGALYAAVSRSMNISAGDIVYAPGPGALPIGTVARVDGDPSVPSVILRIASAVNLFATQWVTLRETGAALSSLPLSATTTSP